MKVHIFFEPLKLISACAEIKREYKDKYDYEYPPSGHLETLLEEISGLNVSELENYANMLKNYDLNCLAWHLPKEENIILNTKILKILCCKISKDVFEVYFKSWQKHYCVLSNSLGTKNLFLLSDKGDFLPENVYTAELRSQIPLKPTDELFSEYVSETAEQTNETYTNVLSVFFLISPSSVLGINILKKIYLICSENCLLQTSDMELCNIANAYTTEDKIKFFVNFISKVSPVNYRNYLKLADLSRTFFDRGRYSIDDFETDIRIRFRMWFSLLDLDRIFGEDERGIFWKARAIENNAVRVEKKTRFDMIIMYFEKFVATEFLEIGAVYIVSNKEFNSFTNAVIQNASSKAELKSNLYRRYMNSANRIEHRRDWRSAVQARIQQLR